MTLTKRVQAALGTNPKDGERVVLQIGFEKEKFVLGTLVKSTCDQMHLDLLVDRDFTLEHSGSTSVFVTGYVTAADLEEGQEFDDEEEDEEEDEDEEGKRRIFGCFHCLHLLYCERDWLSWSWTLPHLQFE